MYRDRTPEYRLKYIEYVTQDPEILRHKLLKLTDMINELSDELEVVTDYFERALAYDRAIRRELVYQYLKKMNM